ncbi:tyrosine-type recombinase/integrase [Glutamicibacter bergerei]
MTIIVTTFEAFFTSYLMGQKSVSPNTLISYRDTWRLLLTFLFEKHRFEPSSLDFEDLDVQHITEFLAYLEDVRGNSPSTRNTRLAGIHAFFHYATYRHPEHADLISRVLALAPKKTATKDIDYLSDAEAKALTAASRTTTWIGRRDQAMIQFLLHTGLRVSELVNLRWTDLQLHAPAYVACKDKGRKERSTPVNSGLVSVLTTWWDENAQLGTSSPIFPTQVDHHAMTPRCYRPTSGCSSAHSGYGLPHLETQGRYPSCSAAHLCHADVGRRHRLGHNIALAWSFQQGIDSRLPPCGHDHQAACPRPNCATRDRAGTIQASGFALILLGGTLILIPRNQSDTRG